MTFFSTLFFSSTLMVSGIFLAIFALQKKLAYRMLLPMWLVLFLWSVLGLYSPHIIPTVGWFESIQQSLLILFVFSHYFFIIRYTDAASIFKRLFFAAGFFSIVNLAFIWSHSFFSLAFWNIALLSHIPILLELVIFSFSLWALFHTNQEEDIRALRPTALLFLIATTLLLLKQPISMLFAHGIFSVAALQLGYIFLKEELEIPRATLKRDLETTNNDLKHIISENARQKKMLEQLNDDLETAKVQKSTFLGTMSHELRTPLNSIVGYSELLNMGVYGDITDQQRDRIEKIHRNGETLLGIIDDVLDLSKIEAGRLELDQEVFNPQDILYELIATVEPRCQAKQLRLHIEIDKNLPNIQGDRRRIYQIFHNLTDNAVKFTDSGHVSITAKRLQVEKGVCSNFSLPVIGWLSDGIWFLIAIEDSGIGIAPEDQAEIFQEFGQIDSGRTRKYEGTGLGLTVARKLTELHNGSLWLKSQSNEGSTFFVAIPSLDTIENMKTGYHNIIGSV